MPPAVQTSGISVMVVDDAIRLCSFEMQCIDVNTFCSLIIDLFKILLKGKGVIGHQHFREKYQLMLKEVDE